jgi:hypothetical protein
MHRADNKDLVLSEAEQNLAHLEGEPEERLRDEQDKERCVQEGITTITPFSSHSQLGR